MNATDYIRPVIIGLALGGATTAFVGFSYGGWTSASKAKELAVAETRLGVGDALAPYCVLAAQADPAYGSLLESLKAGSSYDRTAIVTKAGWATPIGATEPNSALAAACQQKLSESFS